MRTPRRLKAGLRTGMPALVLVFAWLLGGVCGGISAAELRPPLTTAEGYAVPQPGRRFEFPHDHGAHPEFKLEWWYVTGHLFAADERRFGFQATFFRRAGPMATLATNRVDIADTVGGTASPWFRTDEVHLAHIAVLDVRTGKFVFQERLNRRGWDADAATNSLHAWNGNWSLRMTNAMSQAMELVGSVRGEAAFRLALTPEKPLVVFGENGVSRKGASPTAASHYLTFTRLKTAGTLRLGSESLTVQGRSWMDHEISSSQLDPGQAGWDWACLQLHDGRDVMAYRMRRKDGSTDPFSTLAWVDASGRVTHVGAGQFSWQSTGTARHPRSGVLYPSRVKLTTSDPAGGTGAMIELHLDPLAPHQELDGGLSGIPYWEGACRVLDAQRREVGAAFLELTGYAGALGGRF
ncbi:carotenoid 1,2-hydratase [Verrucomicrobiota bacterium]|nr:carotenoid 1,2-hydratase [Verrucomicrobiota bacterium]